MGKEEAAAVRILNYLKNLNLTVREKELLNIAISADLKKEDTAT